MSKKQETTLASWSKPLAAKAERQEAMPEQVQEIPPAELKPFRGHPFKVLQDEEMETLCQSIQEHGILSPLVARPDPDGGYELISGHRRKFSAELLGLETVPVLIREMDNDDAAIILVDSNIQRENLLPSEKAFAYKMKLTALKHQGKTSCQVGAKLRSDEIVAGATDKSARTIQRYIRLTELIPSLLDLVDQKQISFSAGVELSYLTTEEQTQLWEIIRSGGCTPSRAQALRMKELSQSMELTPERMAEIIAEEASQQKEHLKLPVKKLQKYFPKGYTSKQMMDVIFRLLEEKASTL